MRPAATKKLAKKTMAANRIIIVLIILSFAHMARSQRVSDSTSVNKKRLRTFVIGSSVAYGGTLVALNQLWYKDNGRQSFRFFNDNDEWKQVDKIGHFYSSFYFGYGLSRALGWCNVPQKKSDFTAALTSFLIMVPIEVMDGFSDAYGASTGDLAANAAGSLFYLGQTMAWREVRIYPKFSFQETSYARQSPNLLGDGHVSEFFKDYNGQTYWLSVDMDKFMKFPKWLNVAVGYGAHGMVKSRDFQNIELGYDPFRQYYLSIDFDLTAIRTRSKAVKTLIFIANMIKLPAPALEFSRKGTKFHPFYF